MNEAIATILSVVMGVVLTSVIAFCTYVARKLAVHDTALAVILQELHPRGEPSLAAEIRRLADRGTIGSEVPPTRSQPRGS